MMAMDQAKVAVRGCCSGHDPCAGVMVGFPKSWRLAATRALMGFQSAMKRSQVGMPSVGTKLLDSAEMGKRMGMRAFAVWG